MAGRPESGPTARNAADSNGSASIAAEIAGVGGMVTGANGVWGTASWIAASSVHSEGGAKGARSGAGAVASSTTSSLKSGVPGPVLHHSVDVLPGSRSMTMP
ncbi:Uncharacterised protein [Nocardia asteroides]|nr:hypothetical protein SAMN05444423_102754 [Nocardia asteroides]VEG35968.1 Uncharacterised protein [Nocardia asteroides]